MFYNPEVIINMYERLNTNALTEDHFLSLNRLKLFHQHDLNKAIEKNSLAYPIYQLALCLYDDFKINQAMKK